MIQIMKIILLVLGSVILQITLIARVSLFGNSPDLPLALVVSVALLRGSFHGELVGFTSGLLNDLFSGVAILGIQPLSKVIIGYFTGLIRNRLYPDNFITQLISGFVATLVSKFITSVHLSLLFGDTRFFHIRFFGLILAALANSILVIVTFWILKRFVQKNRSV